MTVGIKVQMESLLTVLMSGCRRHRYGSSVAQISRERQAFV